MTEKERLIEELENYEPYAVHFPHLTVDGKLILDVLRFLRGKPEQKFFVDSDGKITPLPIHPQWISVKKKLPEQAGYSCLVSAEYGDGKRAEFIAFTGYGESEWYTYDALFMEKEREADNRVHHNYHITHWMPLPEPPEVKQDD